MMKLLIAIIMLSLVGCSQVRTWTLEASLEDMKSAETSRQVADNLMSTWPLNSGAMQCGMEEIMPPLILKKIEYLDWAVASAGKWNADDYNRGCFLGKMGSLTYDQAKQVFDKLMPLIIKAVGM